MGEQNKVEGFEGVDDVISDPLRFKVKLGIGEDAYTSLRLKNKVFEVWDTIGAAGGAATVAQSSVVASSFFAPSGILGILGIGSAVTPIGWVLAAACVGGAAWYGVNRFIRADSHNKVIVIPHFINTPMDVLALGIFDLLAPLALKVADIDGRIDREERVYIKNYFIEQWGYAPKFIDKAVAFTESKLSDFKVKEAAEKLASFQKENKDCNFDSMAQELDSFLRGIMEADGMIDEREEMAIEKVKQVFNNTGKFSLANIFLFNQKLKSLK
ncbi:MAG: TerB family tellurite resistance protein [Mariprofundaceae bacterium]